MRTEIRKRVNAMNFVLEAWNLRMLMLDQEQKQQERLYGAHTGLSLYAKYISFNSLNGCETMSVQLCTVVYFCLNHTGDSEFNEKGKAANTGYLPYNKTKNVSNVYKSFPSADPSTAILLASNF